MTTKPKILIVGAGIGGLTAANALRQAGMGVEVFERAAELKEIGTGIALSTMSRLLTGFARMSFDLRLASSVLSQTLRRQMTSMGASPSASRRSASLGFTPMSVSARRATKRASGHWSADGGQPRRRQRESS